MLSFRDANACRVFEEHRMVFQWIVTESWVRSLTIAGVNQALAALLSKRRRWLAMTLCRGVEAICESQRSRSICLVLLKVLEKSQRKSVMKLNFFLVHWSVNFHTILWLVNEFTSRIRTYLIRTRIYTIYVCVTWTEICIIYTINIYFIHNSVSRYIFLTKRCIILQYVQRWDSLTLIFLTNLFPFKYHNCTAINTLFNWNNLINLLLNPLSN